MTALQLAPERDFRGPGCGEGCRVISAVIPGQIGRSELLLHDPRAHELYGRAEAESLHLFVRTGALAVDLNQRTVSVWGSDVRLTPSQWGMLEHLARRMGMPCSSNSILAAAWGPEYFGERHLLRVHMARLRSRLGPCAGLIATRVGYGYKLLQRPPVDVAVVPKPAFVKRWATHWDACRACGTTETEHHAYGLCGVCRHVVRGRADVKP